MRICVLDTETTGLDPAAGAEVAEVAWVVVDSATGRVSGHYARLCSVRGGVPPEARAVHHLGPEELEGRCTVAEIVAERRWDDVDVFAAHNCAFDRPFMVGAGLPERPWICTYRVARHVWRAAPGYGNQVLRYWLGVRPAWPPTDRVESWPEERRASLAHPHRALYDVCTTAAILLRQLETPDRLLPHVPAPTGPARVEGNAAEHLIWMTERPVLLETCHFGKHRGAPWAEVPKDYLRWMLNNGVQADDRDVLHTVRHHLGLPGAE